MTAAPHKLTWTSEKPTQEGWWWFRFKSGRAKIVYVQRIQSYGSRLCALIDNWIPLDEIPNTVGWAGPIPLPEEPQ